MEKLKNIKYEKRTNCSVCDTKLGSPVITYLNLPLSELYVDKIIKEKVGFSDLFFHICNECGHAQLSNIISPELLYSELYSFRTSKSHTAKKSNDFFLKFANKIMKNKHKSMVDVGANDLHLLKLMKDKADRLIGVDPVSTEKDIEKGIEIISDFSENIDFTKVLNEKLDLVISTHTLEHVKDPKIMIGKLFDHANENTLFIFEFPGFETLFNNFRFDQIFHQHLQYFSVRSFIRLMDELDGELIDFTVNYNHWGALLVAFKKNPKKDWKKKFNNLKIITEQDIKERYELFKNLFKVTSEHLNSIDNSKIYGYGATLTLPLLSYHLQNDLSCLEGVLDDDKDKHGLFYANLPIEVLNPSSIKNLKDSVIFVTAIDSAPSILKKVIDLEPRKVLMPMNIIV